MKKLLAILCVLGLVFSGTVVLAEQKPELLFSLGTPFQGEVSSVLLEITNLKTAMTEKTAMSIIFSKGFLLSGDISIESVLIDGSIHPTYLGVNGSNNIHLEIPATRKDSLSIEFLPSANIQNPIDQESVSISLVLEEIQLILFSQTIPLSSPDNSVQAVFPKKLQTVGGFYPEEFSLMLVVSKNSDVFYALDNKEFIAYQKPILIQNGKHQLSYYGKRPSGAVEPLQELTLQVDSMAPDIKIIEPPNKKLLNQKNQKLKVQIKDYSPVHFQVLGQDIAVLTTIEGLVIEIPIILEAGENVIPYRAIDQVGLVKEGTLTYFVDQTPPALVVYSPKKGEVVCGSRVEISGKAELSSVVMMMDQRIKTDAYGNFSLQIIPTSKGINQLNIVCMDLAGNENRINYSYYYFPGRLFEFLIGQNKSKIDGIEKDINPSPILDSRNGEIYVPLRFVSDALGFELNWNPKESLAVMKKNKIEIELRPNITLVRIHNGLKVEKIELLYTPTLYKGSIMVPAEFLKKILGAEVIYDLSNSRMFVNFCDKVGNQ